MIGPFPGGDYSMVTQRLESGDRIMMYTDGIPETKNMAEVDYGDQRLRQFLLDSSSLSAEEFIDHLLVEVNDWAGLKRDEPATDDLTVVVIDLSTGN
jgi:serine phosphatase RsbU (regulator of sigma subunit)